MKGTTLENVVEDVSRQDKESNDSTSNDLSDSDYPEQFHR